MNIECGLCGQKIAVVGDGQDAVRSMVGHVARVHPGDPLLIEPQIVVLGGVK